VQYWGTFSPDGSRSTDTGCGRCVLQPSRGHSVPKPKSSSDELARQVDELQVRALQCTIPGESAALFNRAGDLLLAAQDAAGAVDMYGRAVDSFVEADRVEAAMALCRKIIRTRPHVVRARCTLSWLVIGAGYTAEAEAQVGDYVSYAERSGRDALARWQLQTMSRVACEHPLRLTLGDYLLRLGDSVAANEVFGEVYRECNGGARREVTGDAVWQEARRASLLGPHALAVAT
jgi:hypothetical protein